MFKRLIGVAVFLSALAFTPAQSAPTSYMCVGKSGAWHCNAVPYAGSGGAWRTPKGAYVGKSGAWQPFYSTPTVSASSVSGSGSGASSAGTVSTGTPSATPGGYYQGAGSWSWACLSGTCASISNSGAQNPTWSYSFSGVGCQSSSSISGTWQVTFTDAIGYSASQNITVGNLTWNNTTSCFTPHNDTFTGGQSGTETVPSGASSLTIIRVGGGANGGNAALVVSTGIDNGGGGGGSGGYNPQTIAISPSDWGVGITYAVGQGAASSGNGTASSTTGSLANGSVSASAGGGSLGGDATSTTGHFGAGGAGGTPGGNAGGTGGSDTGGTGGAAPYSTYGRGGDGSGIQGGAPPGNYTDGVIIFQWS